MTTIQIILSILAAMFCMWVFLRLPYSDSPISILLNALSGFFVTNEHKGKPSAAIEMSDDIKRYKGATPPANTSNVHGEIEYLVSGIPATHWYEEVNDCTYHFVTAGDPSNEAILFVPGLPESWWAFHQQMSELSSDYYVIAMDSRGFGQSDKRLDLDYTNPAMAKDVAALMDKLGIEQFNMAGHDRGAVITDHMTNVPSLKGRILRYVRMQQSFNEPHGSPVPPHKLMGSRFGQALFGCKNFCSVLYRAWFPSYLSESTMNRLEYEFGFKGTAAAQSKYFRTTNFDLELADRHDFLFKSMTMPMLILQGRYDKGQHPEEYDRCVDFVSDARVQFIHANHFFHLENPTATNHAFRRFLSEKSTNSLSTLSQNTSIKKENITAI